MQKYTLKGFNPEPQLSKHYTTSLLIDTYPQKIKAASTLGSLGPTSMRHFSGTRHNQGQLGSCVANAVTKALEIQSCRETGTITDLSRLAVYYLAREAETHGMVGTVIRDNGTYVSEACDIARRFGVPTEQDWPYLEDKVNVSPGWRAMRSAYRHRIGGFYRLLNEGERRCNEINIHLHAGNPVVFGMQVTDAIHEYRKGEVLQPSGGTIGRHAMVIIGVDKQGNYIVENSWGTGWGDDGFCLLSPALVGSKYVSDLWTVTSQWS